MPASARVPNMAALLGIVLVWSIASTAVGAHESWINRGGYRNSAGEWCCGDKRLRISRSDRGYREGLGHRRQGIRPVRRGHAKSGREDLDLPPARSHTPLCIRTATRLVARRRCGKIRQISARFHKSTVAGVDHRGQSLRKVPRGQRGVPEDPCGKEPRNLVCANLPTPCRLAISRCIKRDCALGNSRATIRGASCSGGAAPQQT